ncbi:MAG: DUF6152 family protein [Steroidobacteraceae bacterium]
MRSTKNPGRHVALYLAAATLCVVSAAAMAHHSFAMFDSEHQVKISGQVSRFDWANPHIYIFVTGGEAGKEAKSYTIEGASPGILNRIGWKFNMIKAGDKVTMVIAPLRSGEAGGLLKEIKLPDGRVFNNGGFAGPSAISLKDEK